MKKLILKKYILLDADSPFFNIEMMGLIGAGNNPQAKMTVAVAPASKKRANN